MRSTIDGRRWMGGVVVLALAAAFLCVNALVMPLDHDESQYVAGTMLAARGEAIFRSFMSLQPPLQTWVYAPVAWAFPQDAFIALRLTTAVLALGVLSLLHLAQRALGIRAPASILSCALAMTCGTFVFTSAVVRNDMLALALVTTGMWSALRALRHGGTRVWEWAAAGLCFGLAASTKLSFAPYALCGAMFLLRSPRPLRVRRLAAYGAGGMVGTLPVAFCATVAPDAFLWGVLVFAATAPFDWYGDGGGAARLTLAGKGIDLFRYALSGPLVPALALVAAALARRRLRIAREPLVLLLLLLAAGMIGAAMPTPTQKQYLLPILPPAFALLGGVLDRLPTDRRRRAMMLVPLVTMALIGLAKPMRALAALRHTEAPALGVDRQAAWIGAQVRRYGDAGDVATLSPDRLAGSGYGVSEDFATGPFVMRSGHLLLAGEAIRLNVVTPRTLDVALRGDPPAALLTGYEDDRNHRDLEYGLRRWATARGYVALRMPDGDGVLHVCPGRVSARGCR